MSSNTNLWVVIPVYNEAESIRDVVSEWVLALRAANIDFLMMVINDGSTDSTPSILDSMSYSEVKVWHRPNTGHGPSCIFGYQTALQHGCKWILQIDSDGQCDPSYFSIFWTARESAPAIFGCRVRRDDGRCRWVISRVLSLILFLITHHWIKDANVPYRLIRADTFKSHISLLPPGSCFPNVSISSLFSGNILWIPIRFRKRLGGRSTFRLRSLICSMIRVWTELRELNIRSLKEKEDREAAL